MKYIIIAIVCTFCFGCNLVRYDIAFAAEDGLIIFDNETSLYGSLVHGFNQPTGITFGDVIEITEEDMLKMDSNDLLKLSALINICSSIWGTPKLYQHFVQEFFPAIYERENTKQNKE